MKSSAFNFCENRNILYPAALKQIRCSTDFTEQPKERRYYSTNLSH
ncbi:hypothetical protein SDC9_84015 [bioreactor metagenome]|uniref:Uncharacterized protein n=1 Tax=bioreactor metagenome TaxID=1076179 RepID=A0A644ZBY2_9ZZZZ|nr:hypothetical protein [Candidatus Metalachnospira sp.]